MKPTKLERVSNIGFSLCALLTGVAAASFALGGCSSLSDLKDRFMGPGAPPQISGGRRTPSMNPGGENYTSGEYGENAVGSAFDGSGSLPPQAAVAVNDPYNTYRPDGASASPSPSAAPAPPQAASGAQEGGFFSRWFGADRPAAPSVATQPRRTPTENQAILSGNRPSGTDNMAMSAPVEDVQASPVDAISAPQMMTQAPPPATGMTPMPPAAMTETGIAAPREIMAMDMPAPQPAMTPALATGAALSADGYPRLGNVPATPLTPEQIGMNRVQTTARIQEMSAEQQLADATRHELMAEQAKLDNGELGAMPPPEPSMMAEAAPPPPPMPMAEPKREEGWFSWVKNPFAEDEPSPASTRETVSAPPQATAELSPPAAAQPGLMTPEEQLARAAAAEEAPAMQAPAPARFARPLSVEDVSSAAANVAMPIETAPVPAAALPEPELLINTPRIKEKTEAKTRKPVDIVSVASERKSARQPMLSVESMDPQARAGLEPIRLRPPSGMQPPEASPSATTYPAREAATLDPIRLTPPALRSADNAQYLGESRYAERRARARAMAN